MENNSTSDPLLAIKTYGGLTYDDVIGKGFPFQVMHEMDNTTSWEDIDDITTVQGLPVVLKNFHRNSHWDDAFFSLCHLNSAHGDIGKSLNCWKKAVQ